MGLKDDLQKDIAAAFNNDLADAVSPFVLTHFDKGEGVYDTSTGLYTGDSTDYSSRGVFGDYDQMERANAHIEATDVKLIVLQNKISVEPSLRDTITQENSKTYRIITVFKDPVNATYKLQIRSIQS
jgi:hypothetical protein